VLRSGIRRPPRIAGIAALAGLCLIFRAEGAAASPKTIGQAAKRLGYDDLLRSGSEHVSAKQWPQAISDLQAALRTRPKDATALSELSFALLMTKKIDQAQRTAEDAVKFASTSDVKASGIFQLGRVAEARSRSADAMEHYLASLKLRHSDETVFRLYHLKEWSDALPCRSARFAARYLRLFVGAHGRRLYRRR